MTKQSAYSLPLLYVVRSFGTEGRRGNPAEELPPSDEIYPYVVFRGADVKDLHVMTAPAKAAGPPKVPNDPAVVGVCMHESVVEEGILETKYPLLTIDGRPRARNLPQGLCLHHLGLHHSVHPDFQVALVEPLARWDSLVFLACLRKVPME